MKVKWSQENTTKAVYAIIVGCIVALFVFFILNIGGVLGVIGGFFAIITPFIWGFAIAYIFNRPIAFFETKVFGALCRKNKKKAARGLAITIVFLISLLVAFGLISILFPQLIASITNLADQLPNYFESFIQWLTGVLKNFKIDSSAVMKNVPSWENVVNTIVGWIRAAIPNLNSGVNFTVSLIGSIANAFIALIASIYLQLSKERFITQLKKLMFGLFPEKAAENMIRISRDGNRIFSKFISGKLLESLFVTVVTFLAMTIFGLHYSLLIALIMGIFNLLPFFGPFIGAIPSAIILLMVNPYEALAFIIITVVLQQIDGQIIGPKILGDSTGLTAFCVIFAIILGGGLFGVLGMILGIPVFAILYSLIHEFIDYRLKKKGLSTDARDYQSGKVGTKGKVDE